MAADPVLPRAPTATCLVVMGPSGIGKTTTAERLASRLGWAFAEADTFHPRSNIDKMTAGTPLGDADRAPWLALIRDWIDARAGAGASTVITCSALKRRYRDVLREAGARVRFVQLAADSALVASRLARRAGHYMPASLLQSQFDDLEPLEAGEDGVVVSVDAAPDAVVDAALEKLGLASTPAPLQESGPPLPTGELLREGMAGEQQTPR